MTYPEQSLRPLPQDDRGILISTDPRFESVTADHSRVLPYADAIEHVRKQSSATEIDVRAALLLGETVQVGQVSYAPVEEENFQGLMDKLCNGEEGQDVDCKEAA